MTNRVYNHLLTSVDPTALAALSIRAVALSSGYTFSATDQALDAIAGGNRIATLGSDLAGGTLINVSSVDFADFTFNSVPGGNTIESVVFFEQNVSEPLANLLIFINETKPRVTTSGVVVSSNVATATATAHGLEVGDWIYTTGLTTNIAIGSPVQVASVPDANTFTYPLTATDGALADGVGTVIPKVHIVTDGNNVRVTLSSLGLARYLDANAGL